MRWQVRPLAVELKVAAKNSLGGQGVNLAAEPFRS